MFGIKRREKTIGMGILRAGELHFCILPEYQGRWLTRSLLKQINKLPATWTKVDIESVKNQKLAEKIGFVPTGQDDNYVYYEINQIKYG